MRVKPMRGQILQLDAGASRLAKAVIGNAAHLVQRNDGRLLLGGTFELVGFQKRNTAQATAEILAAAIKLCSAISQLPLVAQAVLGQASAVDLNPFRHARTGRQRAPAYK